MTTGPAASAPGGSGPGAPASGGAGIVARVAELMRARYVLPDRGAAAADRLLSNVDSFDGMGPAELCAAITAELRSVCPDVHLAVEHRPATRVAGRPARPADGVERVQRLPGNVGYLELTAVRSPEISGEALAAAMTLLRDTTSLLLDLRGNLGGSPDGVAFLCSYLLSPEPVHLNDVHDRVTGTVRQFWSYAYVPGPRYLDRPVYVLIGPETFSGGEEIAYNLRQLGRATLVGQATRGGAHPAEDHWLGPHIRVRVPQSRSVNPISGTNWEGIGVQPDVPVPAEQAYDEAYRLASAQIRPSSSA